MWLFSKHGFFSAVENFNDANLIHVRARFQGDLERLCAAHGVPSNVKQIPGSDYPFRMDFGRETWGRIVRQEAENIDYTNFKDAVHDGTKRDRAYMEVWGVLQKYED